MCVLNLLASGQNATQQCPTITVSGPAGVINPGEYANFTATINGDVGTNLTYFWKVTGSRVFRGQGTSSLDILLSPDAPFQLAATVEIGGLPKGCKNTAFETFSEAIDNFNPIKLGEFVVGSPIKASLVAKAEKEVGQQPNAQLFITLQFPPDITEKSVERVKKQLLLRFELKFKDRIVFVTANEGGHKGIVWLSPPGTMRPTP